MKKFFILSLSCILISSIASATIRRIQYWGIPVPGVDFATGDAAVAASAIGDTIMVFHSTTASFTLDKRLVIIGPGYWNWLGADANFNANLQNIQGSGYLTITFTAGSDSSTITGCRFNCSTTGASAINNVKIRNCSNWGVGYWFIGNGSDFVYDNWEFSKCHLQYYIYQQGTNSKFTNLKIFNCLIEQSGGLLLSATLGQTGIVENCSFYGGGLDLGGNGFLVQNSIFNQMGPASYVNSVFNNNVFYNTPSPSIIGAGNIFDAVYSDIYIGIPTIGTNSMDGKFKLKPGSPAIGAGISGIDCGAYGGVNPYKLSMIPAVPAFYKLTAPGTAASTNPYQITFSVRANN